jgi:branched-chain amino acid transport system substrate-binding protein
MISPGSSNPMLTELGRANVFRVINRDDANGVLIGDYLADHWSDKKVAILHDNTTYGKRAAEEVKKSLNSRGLIEAIYQAMSPARSTTERKSISFRRQISPWHSLAATTPRSG